MVSVVNSSRTLGENEIRLFRFERMVRPITGTLSIYDLSEAPVYRAISYTWAEAYSLEQAVNIDSVSSTDGSHQNGKSEKTIHIDGCPRVVQPNLYAALQDLDTYRDINVHQHNSQSDQASATACPVFDALWIDAICISQENSEEKASQVKLIGRIFSQAQTVLVYLGPEHAFLDSLRWCVDDFAPRLDNIPEELLKLYHGDGILKPQLHYRLGYPKDEEVVRKLTEAIRFFAQCRWYQRTWTLQETILASHVLMFVGTQSLSLVTIQHFVKQCVERAWSATLTKNIRRTIGVRVPHDVLTNAYKRSRIEWESTKKSADLFYLAARVQGRDATDAQILDSNAYQAFRLADMLFTSSSTDCSDKRDKVFSCIGMAGIYSPRLAASLIVDYNSAWEDLYLRVSTMILSNAKSLDALAFVPDALSNIPVGLPTWVLNHDIDATGLPFWTGVTNEKQSPNVFGDHHTSNFSFLITGSCLSCSGAYFDSIKVAESYCNDTDEHSFALNLLRFAQLIPPSVLGRSRVDALWRTYILDGVHNRPIADASIQTSFMIFLLCNFALSLFPAEPSWAAPYGKEHQQLLKDEFIELFGELLVPTALDSNNSRELRQSRKKEVRKAMDIVQRYVRGKELMNRMENPATHLSKLLTSLMYWHYRKVSSTGHLLDQFDLYYNEFVEACASGKYRLFVTEQGFCGAASIRCEPGDQIWCLGSAHSPYLLRPTGTIGADGKRPQFHLVGECYVLDFMDGRMMEPGYGVVDNFQEIDII